MKANTIDLLMTKGQFPTERALAVAEAIDMAIRDADLVTVAILDARFLASEAKTESRFATFEARMDQKFDRLRVQLIIAVLAGYAVMGPLGNAMLETLKRAF